MDHRSGQPDAALRSELRHDLPAGNRRVAAAPISWGACEVPGWGQMPDPEAVLDAMQQIGLQGTELGPPGFLPDAADELAGQLRRHRLQLVGSFQPLVLHDADAEAARLLATRTLRLLAEAGGQVLVVAAVADLAWSTPHELSGAEWRRLAEHAAEIQALAAEHGITFALHPHAGTLIETDAQVRRALEETDVGWCLDTGHLVIGGTDPAWFAREHAARVTHVHLKDVDGALAAQLRAGELSLLQATQRGLFLPLGRGVANVAAVLQALAEHGYDGWFVLEQDRAITADEPGGGQSQAMLDTRESIAFFNTAQRMEEEIKR